MSTSQIARELADDFRSQQPQDLSDSSDSPDADTEQEREDEREEVLDDATEAVEESQRVEQDPIAYAKHVQAQAKRLAKVVPSDDTDELTNYLNEVTRNRPPMTREESMDAARRGDLNALIEGNLLLVVSVALKWRGYNRLIMDLIGEGNVGLTTAAQRYNVTLGWAFSTFGIFYVRKDVRAEAIRQDTQYVSLPQTTRRQLGALYAARGRLERAEGRPFTLHETMARLRAEDALRAETHRRRVWIDDNELFAVLATKGVDYLSALLTTDARKRLRDTSTVTIGDWLSMPAAYDPIAEMDAKLALEDSAAAWIRDLASARNAGDLSEEELTLLCLRFGLPHPDRTWRPPQGWEVGQTHTLRWVAQATGKKYEWTRLRLKRLIARLADGASPVAQRIARLTETPRPLTRNHQGG